MSPRSQHLSFLFRTDEGRIDGATWRRYAILLAVIFVALTLIWALVEPFADHGPAAAPLFLASILAANLYRLFYGFAIIILFICYYNLSAKRWRDIDRPAALAALLPLVVCVTLALHWLEPRASSAIPHFAVLIADAISVAILLWNIVELGGLASLRWRRS